MFLRTPLVASALLLAAFGLVDCATPAPAASPTTAAHDAGAAVTKSTAPPTAKTTVPADPPPTSPAPAPTPKPAPPKPAAPVTKVPPAKKPAPVTPVISAKQKGYAACAAYAKAHHDGTVPPYFNDILLHTDPSYGAVFDLPITTPEGAKVGYACTIPGYPTTFTVSSAGPHDLD